MEDIMKVRMQYDGKAHLMLLGYNTYRRRQGCSIISQYHGDGPGIVRIMYSVPPQ